MRIDPHIGGGQVQKVHQPSTSTEVKFIKSIDVVDNNDIAKKKVTITLIENNEFKTTLATRNHDHLRGQHRQEKSMINIDDNIDKKNAGSALTTTSTRKNS